MKKLRYLNIILFLIIINVFGNIKVLASTNPYKENGPYGTNCTWYTWKIVYEKKKVILPGWGDAKNWYKDALNDGYIVGATPKANSIIVWGDWTSYGHVGYVESVNENIISVWDSTGPCIDKEDPEYINCMANGVSEESDKICRDNAKRTSFKYNIDESVYQITGYIYLDEIPKKESTTNKENNNSSNKKEETTKLETKSSNAYLSSIELSVGSINFNKEIFEYNIDVLNEIESIDINAVLEDKKAAVDGIGNYKLNVGLNEIKLIVKAEDNSKKEYIININRKEEIKEMDSVTNNVIEKEETENNNTKNILLISGILVIVFIVVGLIIKKIRK